MSDIVCVVDEAGIGWCHPSNLKCPYYSVSCYPLCESVGKFLPVKGDYICEPWVLEQLKAKDAQVELMATTLEEIDKALRGQGITTVASILEWYKKNSAQLEK